MNYFLALKINDELNEPGHTWYCQQAEHQAGQPANLLVYLAALNQRLTTNFPATRDKIGVTDIGR